MTEKERKPLLNSDSVVLVTGGAKGITAQCAIRLAETGRCKFILVGRSNAEGDDPSWADGADSREVLQKRAAAFYMEKGEKVSPKDLARAVKDVISRREIRATLNAIKQQGGQAIYISTDVTDEKAFAGKVREAENEFGGVTGVIHGAGNLADKLIENKTEEDFNLVVGTKVKGLRSVINCIDPQKLDFLVLFSSVAGLFGNMGQADYALANEVLNKSAHILKRSLPNCQVISINWGPWDAGMVSPQLKKYFESRDIPMIKTEDGVEILNSEITGGEHLSPQVMVGSQLFGQHEISINDNRPVTIRRQIRLEDNPFALQHEIGSNPVLPATCAASWLVDACEASFPGYLFHRMEDFKVLKGVTIQDDPVDYEMKLEKQRAADGTLTIEATVTSQGKGGRRLFRYSGTVTLTRSIPAAPIHPRIGFENLQATGGSRFYSDGTLFHGPIFQGIQKAAFMDERRVVTEVMLPPIPRRIQGQFPAETVNPYIYDAVVQSLLLWSQENYSAPCLPSRLKEWVNYRTVPFGIPVWAELNVTYHNEYAAAGDILVVGDDGREYFHFVGLEGTISQQLNRYIGKKSEPEKSG